MSDVQNEDTLPILEEMEFDGYIECDKSDSFDRIMGTILGEIAGRLGGASDLCTRT